MTSKQLKYTDMIEVISNTDDIAWNGILEKESDDQMITIAHNPSLGPILAKTFGYSYQNMVLKKAKETVGLLPTVLVRNKIVSIPHFSYGGPIMVGNAPIDYDFHALFQGKKFEIRGFSKLTAHVYDKKISCVLNVYDSVDEQIMTFKSKLRQKIRKVQKMNFEVNHGGHELLDDFYSIYAHKMLSFGSPAIGKVFFKNLLDEYRYGEPQITVVYDNEKPVAAGFSLSYLNFNEVCWSATDSA